MDGKTASLIRFTCSPEAISRLVRDSCPLHCGGWELSDRTPLTKSRVKKLRSCRPDREVAVFNRMVCSAQRAAARGRGMRVALLCKRLDYYRLESQRTGCELLQAPGGWPEEARPKKFDETRSAASLGSQCFAPLFSLPTTSRALSQGYTRRNPPKRYTLTHDASVRYRRCPVRRRLDCARPVVECVIQSPHSVPLSPPFRLPRASHVPWPPGNLGVNTVYKAQGGRGHLRTGSAARTVRGQPREEEDSFNKPKGDRIGSPRHPRGLSPTPRCIASEGYNGAHAILR